MTGMVRFLLSPSCGLCTNPGGGWDIVVRGDPGDHRQRGVCSTDL